MSFLYAHFTDVNNLWISFSSAGLSRVSLWPVSCVRPVSRRRFSPSPADSVLCWRQPTHIG